MLEGALAVLDLAPAERRLERALLRFHAADKRRILRDFEGALADVERAEQLLGDDASSWSAMLRCSLVGQRGWIQQDWGAIDAAARAFERERELVEQLTARNAGDERASEGVVVDCDLHQANVAVLLGEPGRIERVLADRAEFYETRERASQRLKLRLAGAWTELARREDRVDAFRTARETYAAVLDAIPATDVERIRGELRLAALELGAGHDAEARSTWQRAGESLDALTGTATGERRVWTGLGARMALHANAERAQLATWRTAIERELEAFLAEWQGLVERNGGYGFMHNDDVLALFVELGQLSLVLDGPVDGARRAFGWVARAHASSSLARALGCDAPTVERLQADLVSEDGHGVLLYVAGPVISQVYALDRTALSLHAVADQFRVERARRRLARELAVDGGATFGPAAAAAAKELAEALLPDELRARIASWKTVGICGLDSFLGDVPFELLDVGDGKFLGLERATYSLPSIAVVARLARDVADGRPPLTRVGMLALPKTSARVATEHELPELVLEGDALEELLDAYPPALCESFVGEHATASRLASWRGAQVLQLLAHGVRDDSHPLGTSLALAPDGEDDDGLLDATGLAAIFGARDAPRLVVAAACRAGSGAQRRGDAAATDLTGAFLRAGSRTVLASSHDLDLEVARRLSAGFHRELRAGSSPAEALRRARVLLLQDSRFTGWIQPLLMRVVGVGSVTPFEVEPSPEAPRRTLASEREHAFDRRTLVGVVVGACVLALVLVGVRRRR